MNRLTKLTRWAVILNTVLLLSSCGGWGFRVISEQSAYQKVHKTGKAALKSSSELATADRLLKMGSETAKSRPNKAIGYYLEAAETARKVEHRGGDNAESARQYYRHGVGQAAHLIHLQKAWAKNTPYSGEKRNFTVSVKYSGRAEADPKEYDQMIYADRVNQRSIKNPVKQDGIGAPMVASQDWSSERAKQNPFLPKVGVATSLTAVVDFSKSGKARFVFYRPRVSDHIVSGGKRQQLAADFTAPISLVDSKKQPIALGIRAALRPSSYISKMGLYCSEEIDPKKIPLVLVHGLASEAGTMVIPYAGLMADRELRETYQVFLYAYPTGLPLVYPSAQFRQKLHDLHEYLKKKGAGNEADRMVLVGHSLGGVMVSAQVRDFRGAWRTLFTRPIRDIGLGQESQRALSGLFETAPPRFVTRAVFIAAPHRGSKMASSWYARFSSTVTQVPKHLMDLRAVKAVAAMTKLGRDVVLSSVAPSGIYRMRYGDPALKLTENQPFAPWVRCHSIIGNRGWRGELSKSSDGMVAYASSHLDNVETETIVPAWHSAQNHPKTVAEMNRILRLHMKNE